MKRKSDKAIVKIYKESSISNKCYADIACLWALLNLIDDKSNGDQRCILL